MNRNLLKPTMAPSPYYKLSSSIEQRVTGRTHSYVYPKNSVISHLERLKSY